MFISKFIKIDASRWPWQEIGQGIAWWPHKSKWGWKDFGSIGRFGGGWRFKLGIEVGGHSISFYLIFGEITIYNFRGWPWKRKEIESGD